MTELNRQWLDENTVYASSASVDDISRYLNKVVDIVRKFKVEDVYTIIPGIRVSKNSWHSTVVLKIEEKPDLVFKIELEIDLKEEKKPYVYGNFACPVPACDMQTCSYQQLCTHHLQNHRDSDGDAVKYCCCQIEFDIFEAYAAHLYRKHVNCKAVVPNFDIISTENPKKFKKFMDSVDFFTEHPIKTRVADLCLVGADVISNFGAYWIFLWNCQDFASWFLLSLGLPLNVIKPTYTDHVTGSGTESSARSVQKNKRDWGWYKKTAQLQQYNIDELIIADQLCAHKGCEMLPPLPMNAMNRHTKLAHPPVAGQAFCKDVPKMVEHLEYVFCGSSQDLQLDVTQERVYNMFWLTGSSIDAHSSLVLQPWSIGEDSKPLEYYHTVEIRRQPHSQFPELFAQEINPTQIKKMSIVNKGLVKISIQAFLQEIYIWKNNNYSLLAQNCSHFAVWMMDHLSRKHCVAPVAAPVSHLGEACRLVVILLTSIFWTRNLSIIQSMSTIASIITHIVLLAWQLVVLLFASVFWVRNASIKQCMLFTSSYVTNIVAGNNPLWHFVIVVGSELLPWYIMGFFPIASVISTTYSHITLFYSFIRTNGLKTNIYNSMLLLLHIAFSIMLFYDIIVNGSNSIVPAMILIYGQSNIGMQYHIIAHFEDRAFVFEQVRHDRLSKLIYLLYDLVICESITITIVIAALLFPLPYSLILLWIYLPFTLVLLVQELQESDSVDEKRQMHISSIAEDHDELYEPSMRWDPGPDRLDVVYDQQRFPSNLATFCYFSQACVAFGIVSLEVLCVSIGLESIFPHVAHRMNDVGLSMYGFYFWHIFFIYSEFLAMAYNDIQFFMRLKQKTKDTMLVVFPIAIFLLISFTLFSLVVYIFYNAYLATYVLIIGFYPVYLIYAFAVCLLMTTKNTVSNE